jgi:polyhydroxyalkanoate synthesis regulator phasin
MTDETSEKSESTAGSSRTAQSVRDVVERTFLAGMGAAALTKDRVQDLIEDLVHLGQINAEEGRDMVDRLLSRTREDARSVLKRVDLGSPGANREQVQTLQQQLEDQELRIRQLEHRIQLLEDLADRGAAASSDQG